MAQIHVLALDATRQGGAGVYTARLITELALQGHQVTLICHEAMDEVKQVANVHEISRIVAARPFGLWRLASALQLRDYSALLRALRLSPPQLVIASAQPLGWAYGRQFPQVPMVYLPHSFVAPLELASYTYTSWVHRRISIATYHYIERACLRRALATVRFTKAAALAFQVQYGKRATSHVHILPMPIDFPSIQAKPRTSELRLLVVGRLIPSKNVSFLINLLARQTESPWRLDVVGSGPELESLQIAVQAAGLGERITFHGHREDVASFYEQADIFVFPSLLENSPVVLLEAMGHSLATLSYRPDGMRFHGANNEIVEHEISGLLAQDEDHFADLLGRLLHGGYDIDRLGSEARNAITRRNSWPEHAAQIVSLVPHAATPRQPKEIS